MNIQPGTELRHYRILEAIGAGGMGEVYRARDTNLDRDVAVKVLPRDVAGNPVNLARLEREAKAIAALSHPNILAVYDFGTENDTAFLVTELLKGETLRDRLNQGSVTPRKATEIGRQIARGLAAAHDKAIVHRDLKPENIYLSHEGRVKILDFGLATAGDNEGASQDLATLTNLTAPGTVLGTVDYMSPEQVKGQPTDNRSDLFSFGSLLYELVAGARPFHRETHAETMTAILKEEPPELGSCAADVPPALAAIIRRCLEKLPGERFHSAHDLAFSLEALSGSSVSTGAAAALAGVPGPRRRPGLRMSAMLVLAGLVVGAAAAYLLRPDTPPGTVASVSRLSARRGVVTSGRFTGTDGSALYSASWEGEPLRLFPSSPGAGISEALNIENADLLSVSATGELALALDRRYPIGWEAVGTLAVAQPGGAAPRQILENVLVADWGPGGQALAVAHEVAGVVRLEYPIGKVLYESPGWISHLRVHPDGERILIADCPDRGDNRAFLRIVDSGGTVQTLSAGGSWGMVWAPDGETILFSNGSRQFRLRPGGERQPIFSSIGPTHFLDIDAAGRILIATGTLRREIIVKAPGATEETSLSWLDYSTPRTLSNDGKWVLFEEGNQTTRDGYAVYMRGTDGSIPLMLGYGSVLGLSPDSKRIAMVKGFFGGDQELLLVPTGPGATTSVPVGGLRILLTEGEWIEGTGPGDPSSLFLAGQLDAGVTQIFDVPMDGNTGPRPITPADMPLAPGHIVSADGRRVIVKPVDGPPVEFGADGTGPRSVDGILPGDHPLEFDRDGNHVYVQASRSIPSPIYRVDLTNGERELWCQLSPRDPAGVFVVDRVKISADGTTYAYSIRRNIFSLGIIEGLE